MGAHECYPVTPARALQIQRVNHDYQIHKWGSIDIIEGYDLILVGTEAWALEGRPAWSNCDAFSGAAKLGYKYIGVEVAGNYDVNHPRDDMLQGMAELAAALYLEGRCGMDFSHGHRDFNYLSTMGGSSCPGANLYPRLGEVQAEAERIINGETKEEEMIRLPDASGKDFHFLDLWLEKYDYWLHVQLRGEKATEVSIYATRVGLDGYKLIASYPIAPEPPDNPNPYIKLDVGGLLRAAGLEECSISVHASQEITCALREF